MAETEGTIALPATSWQQLEEARFHAGRVVLAFDHALTAAGHVPDHSRLPRNSEYLLVWDMMRLHRSMKEALHDVTPHYPAALPNGELDVASSTLGGRIAISLLLFEVCSQFQSCAAARGMLKASGNVYQGATLGRPLAEATPAAHAARQIVHGMLAHAVVDKHRHGFS